MAKPIIAVDIDDVLAQGAQGFVEFSNATWGHSLTVDDYDEDWGKTWGTSPEETSRRALLVHTDELFESLRPHEHAVSVLLGLSERYTLVAATSRRVLIETATRRWLAEHYPGVFEKVYFTGIYDAPASHAQKLAATKNELLRQIDAKYIIDDQPKHCLAAGGQCTGSILFGDYAWNRQLSELPSHVVRCADWLQVEEYFCDK